MSRFFTTESISAIITILSFMFAIWQYVQNRKIKRLIALEAVELHNNVSLALGATQTAKNAINNGQSPNIEVGIAEGLCQAVLNESAKLYCNLANTRVDDIDNLIRDGQLSSNYKQIYYSYSANKRGRFKLWLKELNRKK